MPIIEMEIKGVEETVDALGELPKYFYEKVDKVLRKGIIKICDTAKQNAPYKTGNLRNSIKWQAGEEPLEYICGTDCDYAELLEYGSQMAGTYPIYPRFKSALAWKSYGYTPGLMSNISRYKVGLRGKRRITTEDVVVKSVMHPYMTPHPFLESALKEHENEIQDAVQSGIIDAIKHKGGEIEIGGGL